MWWDGGYAQVSLRGIDPLIHLQAALWLAPEDDAEDPRGGPAAKVLGPESVHDRPHDELVAVELPLQPPLVGIPVEHYLRPAPRVQKVRAQDLGRRRRVARDHNVRPDRGTPALVLACDLGAVDGVEGGHLVVDHGRPLRQVVGRGVHVDLGERAAAAAASTHRQTCKQEEKGRGGAGGGEGGNGQGINARGRREGGDVDGSQYGGKLRALGQEKHRECFRGFGLTGSLLEPIVGPPLEYREAHVCQRVL